jgi:hypothetical protein
MGNVKVSPRALPTIVRTHDVGGEYVRARERAGLLVRAGRGVYVEAVPDEAGWRQRERIALARAVGASRTLTNGAVLSHTTAALVHGCWLWTFDPTVHVTQPRRRNGRSSTDLVRHHGSLAPDDVTKVNGLRVTTLERTLLDCATTMHPRDALVIADSALRALVLPDRFDREACRSSLADVRERLLTTLGTMTKRGRRKARAVVSYSDPFAESAYESVLRWIAVSRGLPVPVAQLRVATRNGVFFADLGWRLRRRGGGSEPERLVLGEFDGNIKYVPDDEQRSLEAASRVLVAEKRREDALREIPGTTIRRFDRRDLRDEAATFERLRAAFPADFTATLQPVTDLLPP